VIELKEQIQRDIADSRSWFDARGRAGDS